MKHAFFALLLGLCFTKSYATPLSDVEVINLTSFNKIIAIINSIGNTKLGEKARTTKDECLAEKQKDLSSYRDYVFDGAFLQKRFGINPQKGAKCWQKIVQYITVLNNNQQALALIKVNQPISRTSVQLSNYTKDIEYFVQNQFLIKKTVFNLH